jgi:SAM-dependent methyltransferase
MNRALLEMLCCPACGQDLTLDAAEEADGDVVLGELACGRCGSGYPVLRSVPRFVPADNYARNFGYQWNRFRQTQLDSRIGQPISRQRFLRESGWRPKDMEGKVVLDVGCGAGRFVEVALSFGARLVAVDYSDAVDACWANFGPDPNLDVIQADMRSLPLRREQFDYVYCFGVLQHTPDVRQSFLSLPPMLRPGGHLAVDLYPKTGLEWLWPKYWLRPLTKKVDDARLLRIVERAAPPLLAVSDLLSRVPVVGRRLRYLVPVVNYRGLQPLTDAQLVELGILDTFDMLAPAHDHPQTVETLASWFAETELVDVEVYRDGQVIGRARKAPPR